MQVGIFFSRAITYPLVRSIIRRFGKSKQMLDSMKNSRLFLRIFDAQHYEYYLIIFHFSNITPVRDKHKTRRLSWFFLGIHRVFYVGLEASCN